MAPSSDPDRFDDDPDPASDGPGTSSSDSTDDDLTYGFDADTDDSLPDDRHHDDRRPWSDDEDEPGSTAQHRQTAESDETDARPSFSENPTGWLLPRLLAVGTGYGLAILGFGIGSVIYVIAALTMFSFGVDQIVISLAVFVFLQGIAFPVVAVTYLGFRWILARSRDREWNWRERFVRFEVPGLKDLAWTVGGYVGMLVLVGASLVLVSLLNAPTAQRSDQTILQNPEALLLMIPISFLLIGPGEELLFRGIIQDRLRESFSAPAAILLASGAFAPLHIFALTGGIQALLTTIGLLFVPSLIFGFTYEVTDNLTVPVIIHGAYDATIFGSIYLTFGGAAISLAMLP